MEQVVHLKSEPGRAKPGNSGHADYVLVVRVEGDQAPPAVTLRRALKSLLRARGIGRLEILVRGLDVDPNTLRKRLKLAGSDEASVVLTRVGAKPVMVLCRAERT